MGYGAADERRAERAIEPRREWRLFRLYCSDHRSPEVTRFRRTATAVAGGARNPPVTSSRRSHSAANPGRAWMFSRVKSGNSRGKSSSDMSDAKFRAHHRQRRWLEAGRCRRVLSCRRRIPWPTRGGAGGRPGGGAVGRSARASHQGVETTLPFARTRHRRRRRRRSDRIASPMNPSPR